MSARQYWLWSHTGFMSYLAHSATMSEPYARSMVTWSIEMAPSGPVQGRADYLQGRAEGLQGRAEYLPSARGRRCVMRPTPLAADQRTTVSQSHRCRSSASITCEIAGD